MEACSSYNRKVVGSNPGSALLIPEVNIVDIQLKALLGLCSMQPPGSLSQICGKPLYVRVK